MEYFFPCQTNKNKEKICKKDKNLPYKAGGHRTNLWIYSEHHEMILNGVVRSTFTYDDTMWYNDLGCH